MTQGGGSNNEGLVFSVPTSGGAVTSLSSFSSANTSPQDPFGSLTLVGSTLYGMSADGGATGQGTIFSLPAAGGTPTILYSFDNTHGLNPTGDLLLVGSTFYGMTTDGGPSGSGVIFSEPLSGGSPTIMATLNSVTGALPRGDLTLVGSTLYGMTYNSGAHNDGTIFSIPLAGGPVTVVHSFGGTDGAHPYGSLSAIGSTLYGMTEAGALTGTGPCLPSSCRSPRRWPCWGWAGWFWERWPWAAKRRPDGSNPPRVRLLASLAKRASILVGQGLGLTFCDDSRAGHFGAVARRRRARSARAQSGC